MLFTKLQIIYTRKNYLNVQFPFEEFYPLLNSFINSEVDLGSTIINPYRFAIRHGFSVQEITPLFLALSDEDGIFNKLYEFTCLECGDLNILSSLEISTCEHCNQPIDLPSNSFLNRTRVLFELKLDVLEGVKDRIKKQSSSSFKTTENKLEEVNQYLNLEGTIKQNTLKNGEAASTTLELMEKKIVEGLRSAL